MSKETKRTLLNENEVADLLKMSALTLCQWRCNKKGPAYVKMGRIVRYRLEDVENWMAASRVEHTPLTKDLQDRKG